MREQLVELRAALAEHKRHQQTPAAVCPRMSPASNASPVYRPFYKQLPYAAAIVRPASTREQATVMPAIAFADEQRRLWTVRIAYRNLG
jgi:hypothetical protein